MNDVPAVEPFPASLLSGRENEPLLTQSPLNQFVNNRVDELYQQMEQEIRNPDGTPVNNLPELLSDAMDRTFQALHGSLPPAEYEAQRARMRGAFDTHMRSINARRAQEDVRSINTRRAQEDMLRHGLPEQRRVVSRHFPNDGLLPHAILCTTEESSSPVRFNISRQRESGFLFDIDPLTTYMERPHRNPELESIRKKLIYAHSLAALDALQNEISDIIYPHRRDYESDETEDLFGLFDGSDYPRPRLVNYYRPGTDEKHPEQDFYEEVILKIGMVRLQPVSNHRPKINPDYACCDDMRCRIVNFNGRNENEYGNPFMWTHSDHTTECNVPLSPLIQSSIAETNAWRLQVHTACREALERRAVQASTNMMQFMRRANTAFVQASAKAPHCKWEGKFVPPCEKPIDEKTKAEWPFYGGINGGDTCVVCAVNCIDMGLKPCGHAALCSTCCKRNIDQQHRYTCPTCNTAIETILHLRKATTSLSS